MKLSKHLSEIVRYKLQEDIRNIPYESISSLKQGGPLIKLIKKGGKNRIHIKEENKGKFTAYCNGKVTTECISKGKNSPNPIIRKRATFADNARKWNK